MRSYEDACVASRFPTFRRTLQLRQPSSACRSEVQTTISKPYIYFPWLGDEELWAKERAVGFYVVKASNQHTVM